MSLSSLPPRADDDPPHPASTKERSNRLTDEDHMHLDVENPTATLEATATSQTEE